MGGSSAVNYMIYMRGNKRDYDEWAEMGNCGWSYKEVLPYFKKSENNQNMDIVDQKYHGYKGPLNVELFPFIDENNVMLIEALLEKGLPLTDFNGKKQIGANLAQSTSKDGKRMSVNVAYIRPIRNERPNLKIITDAFATNVLINRITKTAFGVQYIKNNRYHKVYARKEVIVSCGSLNSPKLLMLSGIGPRKHLERLNIPVISDLKVGHNLQDHVCTNALVIGLSNKTSTLVTEQELVDEIYEYHSQKGRKTGPLSATGPISAAAFLNVKSFSGVPNIQLSFDGRNVKEFYSDPTTYTATDILPLSFYNGLSARTILLTPKSRGLVELNETDPIFGPPVIYPKFFTAKEDLDTLVAALNYVVSLEQTEIFKANGASFIKQPLEACSDHEWGSENYFKCLFTHYTGTIFHPVGTCKMGPAWDEEAVVDPRLRVYGVKYLRVIDASVMCKIIRGNTNAPTIMTAEKACDLIKEEHLIC